MKINILSRTVVNKEHCRITIVGNAVCFVPVPQYPDNWAFYGMTNGESRHPTVDVAYRDHAFPLFKDQSPVDFNNPENTDNPFIHIPKDGRLGWSQDQLAKFGVPWPPPEGWETKFIQELSFISDAIVNNCELYTKNRW